MKMPRTIALALILLASLLSGCGQSAPPGGRRTAPVAIESGDECHVCGMLIGQFPGPKGEIFVTGADQPLKYCSTRDMFSELLQPEMKAAVEKVYVHDMGATDWDHPSDAAFTDGRTAWYVAGHDLRGAMGPTLAAFAKRADAERFVAEHGGRLIRFEDVTLAMLATLQQGAGMEDHRQHGR